MKTVASVTLPVVDMVNHPPHYTKGKYEVIEVLQDWFPSEPLLWQIVKYVARAKHKNNYLQDLKKARFYLDRAINEAEIKPFPNSKEGK